MRTSPYREDGRAVLTNQHIKKDLQKTGIRYLLDTARSLLLWPLALLFYLPARSYREESPAFFWFGVIFGGMFALLAIYLLVISLCRAVPYLRAAAGNRFFVTPDTLVGKQAGRVITPAVVSMAREYPSLPGPARFERSNRYQFTTATVKMPLRSYHFAFDRDLDMNEGTLFRHSEEGDKFLLVSLKPGKPVKIYPEKRFRYTDSSPL